MIAFSTEIQTHFREASPMRLQPLIALFLSIITTGTALAQDNKAFAGSWSGKWTNSNGKSGTCDLKLSFDQDNVFKGVWDDVNVSGRRSGSGPLQLKGSNSSASYTFTITASDGKLDLKYVAVRAGNQGAYSGSQTLTRVGKTGPVVNPPVVATSNKWVEKPQPGFAGYPGGNEVILIALTWDGSMAKDVCQRAFDEALAEAKAGKLSLSKSTIRKSQPGKNIYLFGYHHINTNKSDWIAIFPGIRTSNGAPASERVSSNGERKRTTSETEFSWPLTLGQGVIITYNSASGGFNYNMSLSLLGVSIRGN
jgi:hypothetical protein